jgi:hypothetical protein
LEEKITFRMDMNITAFETDMATAVVGAVTHAFSGWMPLDSVAPVAAAAAAAAGRSVIRSIVCGALTPRDGENSNPKFYALIAALLRRTLVTGDFGTTGLHVVSLPYAGESTASLMACLQSLDRECSLFEFAADYFVDIDEPGEVLLAQTCAVLRRHRHRLRLLKVPGLGQDAAPAFADALAECTAITSLDLSFRPVPFRSWQQLGPTLHTLKMTAMNDGGTDATFRLLADNMPVLRDLELFILDQFSQDGFIEVVSRLRSLSLTTGSPWDSVHDPGAWPPTLPNLEALVWWGGDGVDAVIAIAVLRRAVSLRAVDVSHASALAAITAGSVAGADGGERCVSAPLANVQTLTLTGAANDAAGLAKIVAALPRASAVRLRWTGSAPELPRLWDLFPAAAASGEEGAGWRRVRRVRLEVDSGIAAPDPKAVARCVRALFPRARYASWCANGAPDVQLLPLPN